MSDQALPPVRKLTSSWGLVYRLYRESLHRHLLLLVLSFACMAAIAAMASAYTFLMGPLVDKVFIGKDGTLLWLLGGSVIAIFVVRSGASYVQGALLTTLGQNIVLDAQKKLFGQLVHQDVSLFQAQTAGSLVGIFTFDVNMLRVAICNFFLRVGKDCMTVTGLIGLMFYTDWRMALYSLMAAPLAIFPILYLSRKLRRVSLQTQEEIGGLTSVLTQAFQGIGMIRAYRLEALEEANVHGRARSLAERLTTITRVEAAVLPVFDGLGGLALAGLIVYGGTMVVGQTMTPGNFMIFAGAVYGAYQPLRSLARVNVDLQTGLAAAERVFALIDRPRAIRAPAAAQRLPRLAGAVEFDEVHFAYDEGAAALKGASFTAPAGTVTALVGCTGAGKSTALNLILRFYDPARGRVLVNGIDLRATDPSSLRDCNAVVSQDVTLFEDTIAGNIRDGRPDASDAEVEAAAVAAGVMEFASRLPQGLATELGERCAMLSGGERQRIAIARALLRDAPILLLDEPTSAQDAASERHIQRALKQLMLGRTTIVVAHRLSTIRHADLIHVFDDGQVVESGSHDELVQKDGVYARLHAMNGHGAPARGQTGDSLLATL